MPTSDNNSSWARSLLWNIFSSGLPPDCDLEVLRKHFLLNLIGILGSLFLVFFSIFSLFRGDYILALADSALLLFILLLIYVLRTSRNHTAVSIVGTAVTGLFFFLLSIFMGAEKHTYLWSLTYPLVTLYLLGRRLGTVFSISMFLLYALFFLSSSWYGFGPQFETILIVRFLAAYITIFLFSFLAEIVHEKTQASLRQSRAELLAALNKIKKDSEKLTIANKNLLAENEERKRVENALKNSQSFLDDIIESIQDGISVLNPDLTIRHTNSVMNQWYARNLPLIGRKCHECYHDNHEPCTSCPTIRCLESGQTEREVVRGPKDSPVEWIELYSFPLKDKESGKITGAVEFVRDISSSKRLEQQLAHSQKMQAVGTLAGGIAHDFNNLLMGIQGRISLMSVSLPPSDPVYEHIEAIEEHIRSATSLTRQLLGTARGGKYDPKPTDLSGLIKRSAEMFGRTRKEITIRTHMPKNQVVSEIDRKQFEQVLLNMFINAWQAMPDGGTLDLTVRSEHINNLRYDEFRIPDGRYARIDITDSGTGMDEATRLQIFDPFFTTKEKGRGTGLGLASAYGIIKNHEGFVTVDSKVGAGTKFSIYLPLSDRAPGQDSSNTSSLLKGSETILLIDDEEMIVEVSQAMLLELGYRVISATGGPQAIEYLEKNSDEIDLVILDLIMPEMDGIECFERIREIAPDMPVILSSGYSIDGQAKEIMEKGCSGFIQKPFNMAALSHKIRTVLARERKSSRTD